jgi:SprT protein
MITADKLREALMKYVPADAVETCVDWIRTYRISVRIKHTRASKYGDYRAPQNGQGHIITINHDLNPYAFLITFTHEVAHLTCYNKFRDRVAPHGEEWKSEFRLLLKPFLDMKIFPDNVAMAVANYIKDPAASSCSDVHLMKALKQHNVGEEDWLHLEDIPYNEKFEIKSGQQFVKGEKLRKNFTCFDLKTKHKYFIHPLMEVRVIER